MDSQKRKLKYKNLKWRAQLVVLHQQEKIRISKQLIVNFSRSPIKKE